MCCIRSAIDHRLKKNCIIVITSADVKTVVAHITSGKAEGFEVLCSDHFINSVLLKRK